MLADIIIMFFVIIPLYAILLWTFFDPVESLLFGRRWKYKERPELSKEIIHYTKFASLTAMIGLPFVLLGIMLDILFLKFTLVLFPLVFIIGAFIIFRA
ncbi:hypothetical protein ACFSCX_23450 [Bacillus salitolerans]|uniref:DUF3784 domain-containing protein n=1 Tax=Bacillus salitolerans TaxID=1437434 RepID=A0ABW4LWL1_9BACI